MACLEAHCVGREGSRLTDEDFEKRGSAESDGDEKEGGKGRGIRTSTLSDTEPCRLVVPPTLLRVKR